MINVCLCQPSTTQTWWGKLKNKFSKYFYKFYDFRNILPSLDPLIKAGDEVQGWADLHQAVVAQQVSLGLAGGSLEDHQVVFVVEDPEAEHGDLHANLDGGVQTPGLLVVEVPGEAGPQGAADWYIVYLVLFWSFRQEGKEIWELFYSLQF